MMRSHFDMAGLGKVIKQCDYRLLISRYSLFFLHPSKLNVFGSFCDMFWLRITYARQAFQVGNLVAHWHIEVQMYVSRFTMVRRLECR